MTDATHPEHEQQDLLEILRDLPERQLSLFFYALEHSARQSDLLVHASVESERQVARILRPLTKALGLKTWKEFHARRRDFRRELLAWPTQAEELILSIPSSEALFSDLMRSVARAKERRAAQSEDEPTAQHRASTGHPSPESTKGLPSSSKDLIRPLSRESVDSASRDTSEAPLGAGGVLSWKKLVTEELVSHSAMWDSLRASQVKNRRARRAQERSVRSAKPKTMNITLLGTRRFVSVQEVETLASQAVKTDPASAKMIYDAGLRQFGENAWLLLFLANFLAQQLRLNEARDAYERAVLGFAPTIEVKALAYAVYAAFTWLRRGDPKTAGHLYDEALTILPDSALIKRCYGEFWLAQGNKANADHYFRQALALEPTNPDCLGALAIFLHGEGKSEEAEELLEMALSKDRGHMRNAVCYAHILAGDPRRLDAAEEVLRRGVAANPRSEMFAALASFLWDVKRADWFEVEELLERATKTGRDSAVAFAVWAGFARYVRRDNDEAERLFERAIETDPSDSMILAIFADFQATERKNPEKARELFSKALVLSPSSRETLRLFADFLDSNGDHQEAESLRIRLNPS